LPSLPGVGGGGRRPPLLLPHRPYDVLVSHEPPYQILDLHRLAHGQPHLAQGRDQIPTTTALGQWSHSREPERGVRRGPGIGTVIVNAANGDHDVAGNPACECTVRVFSTPCLVR
jgi:hypothetical protein